MNPKLRQFSMYELIRFFVNLCIGCYEKAHFFTHCETLKFFRVKISTIRGSQENRGNFALVNYKSLWKCGTEGCRKPSRKYNLQFFTNSSYLIQNYTNLKFKSQKRWYKFIKFLYIKCKNIFFFIQGIYIYYYWHFLLLATCNLKR